MAWSSAAPHGESMTPPVYIWKTLWSASTTTATGCCAMAVSSASSLLPGISFHPETEIAFGTDAARQGPLLPVYG